MKSNIEKISVLAAPHWTGAFVFGSAVLSIIPFLIGFLLGFSVSSDIVFGFYALISGIATDRILRTKFGRLLILFRKPEIQFIWLWVGLCLYVMIFQPLE